MAEQKYKSPEELGEAVGRKIEELFGGLFADEAPQEQSAQEPTKSEPVRSTVNPVSVPKPVPAAAPVSAPRTVRPAMSAPSAPKPSAAKPQPARVAPRPAVGAAIQTKGPNPFDDVMEHIEVIILNLEWEVSPESIRELFQKFKELERSFATEGPARNILAMNMRILPRFDRPESVPHPALLKLLQDSVAALKALHAAPMRPPNQALISSISNSYKQIMSSLATVAPPSTQKADAAASAPAEYGAVLNKIGGAVRSLEEVNQRLARILGVLRQGGDMSVEEITRRLGTLEHLLSERLGLLSSSQKELSLLPKPGTAQTANSSDQNAVLMFFWEAIPLAVPTSSLAGLYPITRAQAEQFRDKPDIALGNLFLRRLPLKKPSTTESRPATWLVHLSRSEKNFFLLAERLIGYRRSPKTVDVENQARLKIGQTVYTLISRSMLR